MDLSRRIPEEISELENLSPDSQGRSYHAAQYTQTARPSQSDARSTQNPRERHRNPSEASQKVTRPSDTAGCTRAGDYEASSSAKAANQAPNEYQEDDDFKLRGPRRTLSTPTNETEYYSTSDLEQFQILRQKYAKLEQKYRHLQSQHEQTLHCIQKEKRTIESLKITLQKSEAERADIQQRLEEASNTIFRLRPQRQEYTESEIEEDYERLVKGVKNWVSINCESFVEDDLLGFDALGHRKLPPGDHFEASEEIILQFQSQSMRWIDAKEHILVAVVMRYLYQQILNQHFSILLYPEERDFLANIQAGMGNTRLRKDLLTIGTWKNETIAAIDSYKHFVNRRHSIEGRLTTELRDCLGKALSDHENESTISSLRKEIIGPTITLAHKTQSSSSIWSFRYSDFLVHKPGEFGSRIPNFLSNIQEFRCINLSNYGKLLKPANELTTEEAREKLLYVLDIFPGLYCQRVTAGDSLPVSTISQPILLVAFASKEVPTHKELGLAEPADSDRTNQNRATLPVHSESPSRSRGIIDKMKKLGGLLE
ncbi:hypothetical protein F5884DRAFT_349945 [Xylogone sp. PMI_703]|nr:hypothetical protein F5884DRAFT_349945 [Xylogone sp. PMI_703]